MWFRCESALLALATESLSGGKDVLLHVQRNLVPGVQSNSTIEKAFALHIADLGSNCSIWSAEPIRNNP